MAIQLKNLLTNVLKVQGNWHISILENWDTIVGYLSKYTYVYRVKNDTIFLGVFESVWMHELFLMSDDLIASINNFLGSEKIKQVKFKLVPKRAIQKFKPEIPVPFHKFPSSIKLTDTQESALKMIQDEELKKYLVNFLERSLQS